MDVHTRMAWWGCLICSNIWASADKVAMAVVWVAVGFLILIYDKVEKSNAKK